jgi:hypothetical protein
MVQTLRSIQFLQLVAGVAVAQTQVPQVVLAAVAVVLALVMVEELVTLVLTHQLKATQEELVGLLLRLTALAVAVAQVQLVQTRAFRQKVLDIQQVARAESEWLLQ